MSLIIPDEVNFQRFTGPFSNRRNMCPPRETMVIIQRGLLISGVFNKGIVGSAAGGLIHVIFKECGSKICADFLSNSQLLINSFLILHGHTVGI